MTRKLDDGGKRALLLEVSGAVGVALTRDGRFVRVRCRPGDEEGREILLEPARVLRPLGARRPALAALAAAAAVCLLVMSVPLAVGYVLASGSPVACVTVDINPSLELGVNRWDRVVGAQALNAEGEAVLSSVEWSGRPVDEVVMDITSAAEDLGFLGRGQDAYMLVAVVPVKAGEQVPPGLVQRLERVKERLAERFGPPTPDGPSVTVETVVADAAWMREEARRLGLSTGRYALFLVAEEAGLDVEPEDFARGVGRAILAAGGHPGAVLREAHECRQVSKLAEKFKERFEKFGEEFRGGFGPGHHEEGSPAQDVPGGGDGEAGTGEGGAPDEGAGRGSEPGRGHRPDLEHGRGRSHGPDLDQGPGRGQGKRPWPWDEADDWPPGKGRERTGPGVPGPGPGWLPELPGPGWLPEFPDSGDAPDEPEPEGQGQEGGA